MKKLVETKGPHTALLQEHTLDHILSFLSGEDWKAARLVCKQWNSRVLTNFHRKLTFTLQQPEKTVCNERSILASCDPRIILSSISIGKYSCGHSRRDIREALQLTFAHLRFRCSGTEFGGLRVLDLQWVDERTLDQLIGVANADGLRGLHELSLLIGRVKEGDDAGADEGARTVVTTGALPRLKRLKVLPHTPCRCGSQGLAPAVRLPPAVQSFVAAAPSLESVESSFAFNLSGRKVKELRILEGEEEIEAMINSVKESLTFLSLNGTFMYLRLPVLPNLTTLIHGKRGGVTGPIDLSATPKLRRLERLAFSSFRWEDLEQLLLAGKLKELTLTGFPAEKVELFVLLMNSGLTRLSLGFDRMVPITELKHQLCSVNTSKKMTSTRLEFHNVWHGWEDHPEAPIQNFSWMVKKLGGRWSLIRFVDFKFRISLKPSWREKKLVYFAEGKFKKGLVKIKINGTVPNQAITVSLETIGE